MLFDFEKFATITESVYPDTQYTLEDTLKVFWYYFQSYEKHTGLPHPPIRASQIVKICLDMPWISEESVGERYQDLEPEHYIDMIDAHFRTKYRRCDYNINHFFSGRIRELRFYEACY